MEKKSDFLVNLILIIIFVVIMYFVFMFFNKNEEVAQENNNTVNIENIMEEKKVEIEILKEGEGEESKAGDTLSVHYTGTFEDGEKFDSSLDRGEPFEFTLGNYQVIEGWEQGMLGMKKGEKRKIYIPYELAYGADGYGIIPPESNLYFEVELLEIK